MQKTFRDECLQFGSWTRGKKSTGSRHKLAWLNFSSRDWEWRSTFDGDETNRVRGEKSNAVITRVFCAEGLLLFFEVKVKKKCLLSVGIKTLYFIMIRRMETSE